MAGAGAPEGTASAVVCAEAVSATPMKIATAAPQARAAWRGYTAMRDMRAGCDRRARKG
jgi:hypothetical protein